MKKLVNRSDRLAFMEVGDGESKKYVRMTGFTSLTNSKNPQEYSRHYVDELAEQTDVVGYSPSIAYQFDRYTDTPVHARIAEIHDGEMVGSDALVNIVVVDLFDETDSKYVARKRTYAVIPDADGDGTDALVYSGTFKSKSELEVGTATLATDAQSIAYSAK